MDREALYLRLPTPAQNWVTTLEGWRIQRTRFNSEFRELLAQYRARELWSSERLMAFQNERVHDALANAMATMSHYRELFQRLKLGPEIRGREDLARLPILTRPEVQANVKEFISEANPTRQIVESHTSGSTGTGLHFPATLTSNREQWAVWWRCWAGHGITRDTWSINVGGRSIVPLRQSKPPFWRYNPAGRQILFSSYHLNPRTAPAYLQEMRRSRVPWIHGYPSMVSLVARYALETGTKLSIRWVTLGAENLLPHQVETIRAAFGVEPIQHYGMAEAAANISLHRCGNLHVDEDFAPVEFVPLGDDQYRIVGSNVSNPAFGLLRYDVGDIATITGRTCDCGHGGRVVDRIDGRQEDFVITKRGAHLGRLDHVFKDLVRVREAQIRQTEPGRMQIWVVKAEGYGEEDERALRQEVLKRVGDEIDFDVEYKEAIPRTTRGKLRFVVSTLEQGQIESPSP